MRSLRISKLQDELNTLKATRSVSQLLSPELGKEPDTYFDRLVAINIVNLGTYYSQVQTQANKSFYVIVVVGFMGFVFILLAIGLDYWKQQSSQTPIYIGAASGIITEFIAAIFFYLYNKTVQQMKSYHDSLLSVQNILLGFKLVDDTKDDNIKDSMMKLMLECLIKTEGTGLKE